MPHPSLLTFLATWVILMMITAAQSKTIKNPICLLPPERGVCRRMNSRFHWSQDFRTCVRFVYGGCRGNGNRFLDFDSCIAACHGGTSASDAEDPQTSTALGDDLLANTTPEPDDGGDSGGDDIGNANGDGTASKKCGRPKFDKDCEVPYIRKYRWSQGGKACKNFSWKDCEGAQRGNGHDTFDSRKECEEACNGKSSSSI